jgi:hypothetical protein
MTAVVTLLVVLFASLLITRIATIALTATGLSREAARFQARSAFSGAGFTTSESEAVVRHPLRRRIIMLLMLLGNAGIVAVIASFVLTFVEPARGIVPWARLGAIVIGVGLLWLIASSRPVDRWITRLTMRMLRRWTNLDARDYASLLHVGGDYVVTELLVKRGDWLADQDLAKLHLRQEGVLVLGIERPDGTYLGVPNAMTVLRPDDVLVVYSRRGAVAELDHRRPGKAGDEAHKKALHDQDVAREEAALDVTHQPGGAARS